MHKKPNYLDYIASVTGYGLVPHTIGTWILNDRYLHYKAGKQVVSPPSNFPTTKKGKKKKKENEDSQLTAKRIRKKYGSISDPWWIFCSPSFRTRYLSKEHIGIIEKN